MYVKSKKGNSMKRLFFLFTAVMFAQQSYAATLAILNQTDNPLEVTAYFGGLKPESETKTIGAKSTDSFSPTLRAFTKLEWRNTNEGVRYELNIPSTRSTNGVIEISKGGNFYINFNQSGTYPTKGNNVEKGVSPNRTYTANAMRRLVAQ